MHHADRFHRRLGVAAFAAWIAALLAQWLASPALNHDESAYALGGRWLLAGEPSAWLHRSVGMHYLAAPGVLAHGSERVFRAVPVLFAIGFGVALWRLGRRTSGLAAAAWSVALVAATFQLPYRGGQLLSDLPAAACLLAAVIVLVRELDRDGGPGWSMLAAAPCLAAAYYIRYGSVVVIAVLAVAAVVVWPRRILARPGPVVATCAALLLLLVPHFLSAIAVTGSPLGILRFSSGVPRRAYFGEGLVTYFSTNPIAFFGGVAPLVALVGIIGGAWRLRRLSPALRFLWLAGVATVVVLGLKSHAQPRYVFFAVAVLLVVGIDTLAAIATSAASPHARWPRLLRAAAVLVVAVSWVLCVVSAARGVGNHRQSLIWTASAARFVRADAAGRPCQVTARRISQLMWYAACFDTRSSDEVLADHTLFYVVRQGGADPQPSVEQLRAALPTFRATTLIDLPFLVRIDRVAALPAAAP